MDIVSRLKCYMSSINITSTQFADACSIPRPSLSQLLNGRNKKVSDEILTKIHDSFPNLSISWLLFGEGNMVNVSNTQFSDPQNPDFHSSSIHNSTETQQFETDHSLNDNFAFFSSNNFTNTSDSSQQDISPNSPHHPPLSSLETPSVETIKLKNTLNKRITNIVVFYDDNSFESFNPAY